MRANKGSMAAAVAAVLVVVSLGCATSAGSDVDVASGTVVRNATVVNTRDGSLSRGMAVVIDGATIKQIAPDASVRAGASVQVIDAAGKYVVPGYLDMHTHALADADKPTPPWPLMIAHGVTGIREMGGSPALIERAQRLNADSAAARVDAPEILQVPSDLVAGPVAPEQAAGLVGKHKADGAAFVKIVAARPDTALAIVAEARKQGLGVAGHLPVALPSATAAAAGWGAVEHLGANLGVLLDCAADEAAVRQSMLRGEGAKPPPPGPETILSPMLQRALDEPLYRRTMASFDEAKCRQVAQAFVRHGTWHVPTLIRLRTMMASDDPAFRQDPNLRYMDRTVVALWQQLALRYSTDVPPSAAEAFRQYYGAQQKLAKLLKTSGVKMLAGSDLGGIWVIPGVGLHQEFRELAAAGFSPLEVLQMTTLSGAQFLGREATMGTVEAGKNADLVLLDLNPTERVENLARISGVLLKGRYFPKEALERMKAEVSRAHASQPIKELGSALDPKHRH